MGHVALGFLRVMTNLKVGKCIVKNGIRDASSCRNRRCIRHKRKPLIGPLQGRRRLVCQLRLKFLHEECMNLLHNGLGRQVFVIGRAQAQAVEISDWVAHARLGVLVVDRSRTGIEFILVLRRGIKECTSKETHVGGQDMPRFGCGSLVRTAQ